MSSGLFQKIQEDTKNAMRARDSRLLGIIRLLLAAIKQREVDERITLDDNQIIALLDKMIKQRKESIDQFQKGNRQDLANKELEEIEVLKKYLPEQLSEDEVTAIINEAIDSTGAASIKDMGKTMTIIKSKAQGRADIGKISATVKGMLESKS